MASRSSRVERLDPRVNRILFVRNLPYKITAEELFDLFGRYGAIRQVRIGEDERKGTAFVVYEDIFDAKTACEHLSGFNVGGRYLTVLYYQPQRTGAAVDVGKAQAEVEALRARVGANEAAAKAGAAAAAAATGAGGGEDDDTALDEDEKDRKLVGRR